MLGNTACCVQICGATNCVMHGAASLTDGAQLTLKLYYTVDKKVNATRKRQIKNIERQITHRTLCVCIYILTFSFIIGPPEELSP